jgi:hypothetical protein
MSRKNNISKISDAVVPDTLWTTEEVSAVLCISTSSLTKWRLVGRGPRFVRVGSRVRYRPADVAAFIEAGTRSSTSEMPAA